MTGFLVLVRVRIKIRIRIRIRVRVGVTFNVRSKMSYIPINCTMEGNGM